MATLVGQRYRARRGFRDSRGTVIEDVYLVRGAAHMIDALLAPGLPRYGDQAAEDPSLTVFRLDPQELDEVGTFDVGISWGPPQGNLGGSSRTFQIEDWNLGLQSQRVAVDLDGYPIGSRNFLAFEPVTSGFERSPVVHEGAQLGTEVQIPMMQCEVKRPIPSPFNPALVNSLIGRTNNAPFVIAGVTFPVDTVILLGARASRLQAQPVNAHDVSYLLAMGASDLPDLPKFIRDGEEYTSNILPLRYGYSTWYFAVNSRGTTARLGEEVAEAVPTALQIHPLYKPGNLGALGIT